MPIRWRLNLLIAGLIGSMLAALTTILLWQAGPRIAAESRSMMMLARDLVSSALGDIERARDPAAALEALVARLQTVRHVSIKRVPAPAEEKETPEAETGKNSLVAGGAATSAGTAATSEAGGIVLPIAAGGRSLGHVVISAHPDDEIEEIREAALGAAGFALLFAVAAFAASSYVTARTLRPFETLSGALVEMERGNYDVALPAEGPPEIAAVAERLTALAMALRQAQSDNRRLSQSLVEAQDRERQSIARDLHDELGPHLFAARAAATAARSEAGQEHINVGRIRHLAGTLVAEIEALQAMNRAVLRRLVPAGLAEVGLYATLQGLLAQRRKEHPEVVLTLSADGPIEGLSGTYAVTVYRVVQEAVTNALRHGAPSSITIHIVVGEGDARGEGTAIPEVAITVADNGHGVSQPPKFGFGLSAMRERIEALGGTLSLTSAGTDGTLLKVRI